MLLLRHVPDGYVCTPCLYSTFTWIKIWSTREHRRKWFTMTLQVQVQVLYFPKEYKWSYTFQKHIEYIQVSMGRKAEKAMLISLLTSGELKKYTQKNARYTKHKKLENIFTQTLLRTHSLYANMNTYSMYHNHITYGNIFEITSVS